MQAPATSFLFILYDSFYIYLCGCKFSCVWEGICMYLHMCMEARSHCSEQVSLSGTLSTCLLSQDVSWAWSLSSGLGSQWFPGVQLSLRAPEPGLDTVLSCPAFFCRFGIKLSLRACQSTALLTELPPARGCGLWKMTILRPLLQICLHLSKQSSGHKEAAVSPVPSCSFRWDPCPLNPSSLVPEPFS